MEEKTKQYVESAVKVSLHDEAPEKEKPQKPWKTTFLIVIWFLASIGNTFLLKMLLRDVRFEQVTSMLVVQLASISLYSWMFSAFCCLPKNNKKVSSLTYWKLILPVAICIFARTRIISKYLFWTTPMGDPFSLAAEALYPVCLLVLGKKFLNENSLDQTSTILIGAIGGIFVLVFFMPPRKLVIAEVIAFAIMTAFEMTYSKKIIREIGIHPLRLLSVLAGLVLLWVLPSWFKELLRYPPPSELVSYEVLFGVFIFGALNWVQTAAAFSLLSNLHLHHYIIGSGFNRITRIFTFMIVAAFYQIGYEVWDFEF